MKTCYLTVTTSETFINSCAGRSDGIFSWNKPISVESVIDEQLTKISVSPQGVHLEIGSTESHKTYVYLFSNRGLARWPYNSDKIIVGFPIKLRDYFQVNN
tara:strand:- start:17 stop:319 length:303 start_codon:yes stop_codon:yes gene_type:complete